MTGRRYYLDQRNAQADFSIVAQWPAAKARNGSEGIIVGPSEQVRGAAWSLREVSDAVFIDPDGSPMRAYFRGLVAYNVAYLRCETPEWTRAQGNAHGRIVGTYGNETTMAPWQQDFFATTRRSTACPAPMLWCAGK